MRTQNENTVHSVRGILLSLIIIGAFTAVANTVVKGSTPGKDGLLNAVAALRTSVRSHAQSGYGIADEEISKVTNGQNTSLGGRVKFWFNGNKCLWRTYSGTSDRKILSSMLIREGIAVQYSPGHGHIRKGFFGQFTPYVTVSTVKTVCSGTRLGLGPMIWTYRYISEISPMDHHDWHFFAQARNWHTTIAHAPKPTTTVRKKGALITVQFNWPVDPSYDLFGIRRKTVFDLSEGGMVKRWKFWTDQGVAGHRMKLSNTVETKWHRVGSYYFPKARTITNRSWTREKNGSWQKGNGSVIRIRFVRFTIAPVEENMFSIARLNIPKGTVVIDNVHRSRFHYSSATAARLLGRKACAGGAHSVARTRGE